MGETGFQRECMKAFLKYGASVPAPRREEILHGPVMKFQSSRDAIGRLPDGRRSEG